MAQEVKSRFPRREARARATREAVLTAARTLFLTGGYAATTMQAIADEADVAVQTVYAVFGNKRSILAEVVDVAIAGDTAEIVVNDRDWMQDVWHAPTAPERLRAYAAAVRRIMESAGDVFAMLSAAASVDAEAASLAATSEERRRAGAASVVESLRSVGRLRPGLGVERAVDVLWLLNGPAVFAHLVRRAGWSPAAYERWLADAMVRELLADEPPPAQPPVPG